MMRLLAVLPLTVVCLSPLSDASRCDDNVINAIRERFWNNGQSIPRNILQTGVRLGIENIVRTTSGYYDNEVGVTCTYTIFTPPTVNLYIEYGSVEQEPTAVFNVIEQDGVLIDTERAQYRYYLYENNAGVRATYKCSDREEVGDPEGLVQTSRLGFDEQALERTLEDMALLGINLSDQVFSGACPS